MVTQTITINLTQSRLAPIIMRSEEKGREFQFDVINEAGEPEDLTGYDLKFMMLKPDDNVVYADLASGILTQSEQMTTSKGKGYYCIRIMDDDTIIYSGQGPVVIDDHVIDDETLDSISEVDGLVFPDDFYTKDDNVALIDDNVTSTEKTWSSSKIASEITSPDYTNTATGNPIELTDAADAPVVRLETEIQGSQDLHGYDKPWVGGAGKNKLNTSANSQTINGYVFTVNADGSILVTANNPTGSAIFQIIASGSAYLPLTSLGLSYDTNYFLSGCPSGGSVATYRLVFRSGGAAYNVTDTGSGVSFNIASDGDTLNWMPVIMIANGTVIPSDGLLFKPQIELGTTGTAFRPYENICPITAYTEGEIEVRGKNLFKASDFDLVVGSNITVVNDNEMTIQSRASQENYNEYVTNNSDIWSIQFDAETLTVTGSASVGLWASANGNISKIINISLGTVGTKTHYAANIPANSEKIYFGGWAYSGSIELTNIQIEKGSTATPYEPYTSTTHTTTYPSAIYRGSEDCVNGEVTSDMPTLDLGSLTWTLISPSGANVGRFQSTNPISGAKVPSTDQQIANMICDCFEVSNTAHVYITPHEIGLHTDGRLWVSATDLYSDVATFTTAMSGRMIAYELATPTTSNVTPTNLPIKSLSGYNHIESTTGEMEVEYIKSSAQSLVNLIEAVTR
ncbi:MAG: hypothetical protein IIY21_21175 [Clostridiales bacterium]|nr:hypothetical protein [Clostridiales bacterium]MBQ1571789.1 hypothetical protein [Clostridiales bacterium]